MMLSQKRRLQTSTTPDTGSLVSHGLGTQVGLWGIYQGQFNEGVSHGYGKLLLQKNTTYEGMFANGKYDGWGAYTFPNETQIRG